MAGQIREGSLKVPAVNRECFGTDTLTADIYWIIENSRLTSLLFCEFPGLRRKWGAVVARLAKRRPLKGQLREAERKVEAFLIQSLFSEPPHTPAPDSPVASFSAAREIKKRWQMEGVPVKSYRGMVPFTPWGRLVTPGLNKEVIEYNAEKCDETEKKAVPGKKKKSESRRYMTKQEKINEENNAQGLALNIFDKIISWAAFVNVPRPFDDDPDDEMKEKADAMEELTLAHVRKSTNAFFDAELEKGSCRSDATGTGKETGERFFLYPEWDYSEKKYRQGFSRVLEKPVHEEDGRFSAALLAEKRGLIKEVRRKFECLTSSQRQDRRQPDGDGIDLDAAVEAMVDLAAGRPPDDRLFIRRKRMERDISSLFLVDLSMSTECWVKNGRIIDHEKEALLVFSEAMHTLGDRHAIHGFSGRTRKEVRYLKIKGFDEPYNEHVKKRIGGLIPYHYTRIGPAIRHAASILKKETSALRLLFLLSDGKPNDMDQYEGRYGIEDTRMAIREAERAGIIPFCLTVDSRAGDYLPRLFGRGNYVLLSGADRLAKKLPHLYARITRGIPF